MLIVGILCGVLVNVIPQTAVLIGRKLCQLVTNVIPEVNRENLVDID